MKQTGQQKPDENIDRIVAAITPLIKALVVTIAVLLMFYQVQ
jgi:hypothetical protein